MKLVIIEGAGKKETIEKYLGSGYKVFATKGHVRDLPTNGLSINVRKNFEPKYVIMTDKEKIVKDLINTAKKAEQVFLATDPDREGEAISWHLSHILGLNPDDKVRIVFNEISKKAVASALDNPRAINNNLVDAQQARRVLDRLVGYKLSPILCRKIRNRLSAGRVQSVCLELVVNREREILSFKPEEFWLLTALLSKHDAKQTFKAALTQYKGKKIKVVDKAGMDAVLSNLEGAEYIVSAVKRTESKSHAPAPFITSTMQQEASSKLGMSLKMTSSVAQELYEGVEVAGEGKTALVTYIRTDSTRVSPDAQRDALDFIIQRFGAEYAPSKPNFYKSKGSAQDAHEAIRPISILRTPDSLRDKINKNAFRLYKLIYERFLASQMTEAIYNNLTVDVTAADYTFRATGKTPVFAGFTAAFGKEVKRADEEETVEGPDQDGKENAGIPDLSEGEILKLESLAPEQKFTKPPQRFTEATLVKAMEEEGIGRPATYTPTITTLMSRAYTEKEGKYLKPTELGFNVNDMLVKYFPEIMNIGFTADMELKLDDIEEGGKIWQSVVGEFYQGFDERVSAAAGDDYSLKAPPEPTDIKCVKCGADMVIRNGRNGKFIACTAYPKCRHTMPCTENGEPIAPEAAVSDIKCNKCGALMVEKTGRYGKFLACPNYPECKNIVKLKGGTPAPDEPEGAHGYCPDCGKALKKRTSRRGEFFGCTGYPKCRFISNFPVSAEKCPTCGGYTFVKDGGIVCADKNCSK